MPAEMRLGDIIDCGCSDESSQSSNKKYIMFQAGQLGIVEAGILTLSVVAILFALKMKVKVT